MNLARILLVLFHRQTFEVIKMAVKNLQLTLEGDNLAVSLTILSIVSIVFEPWNFVSNSTINKTWHGDCRISVVSKILDWLVK